MDVLTVLALAFLAGAATLLGGVASSALRISKRLLHFFLTAASGVVLSVALLGMIPAAMELGGVGYAALGFILGGVVFMISGYIFPHTYGAERYEDKLYSLLKSGSLVMTGLIIFNVAAGLLIGAGFAHSLGLGAMAMTGVVLLNITRGIAISVPLSRLGEDRRRTMLVMLLAGIPCLIGALPAFAALAGTMPVLVASGLAFASGGMIFILADQLMPIIKGGTRVHEAAIALFIGIFVGLLILSMG